MADARGADPGRWPTKRTRAFGCALQLATLLAAHFALRYHAHRALPLEQRAFYPYVYRVSLSLLAGHGFTTFRLSDSPRSRPVAEFLALRRPRLAPAEWHAFLSGPDARPLAHPHTDLAGPFPHRVGEEHVLAEPLYTTRVLDVYVAALLWKAFGIGWGPLFAFYALVSTGACALVFAVGRKLGGTFGAGLLSALFYLASPLEATYTAYSLRDVSPLWFAAAAFAGALYLLGRFRAPAANLAAALFVGVLAAAGYGWRPDALLIAPFLLLALVLGVTWRERGWRAAAAGGAAFTAGVVLTHAAIGLLARGAPRQGPLVGFHMACYGESARCNLLGVENTFQVARDDVQTCLDVQQQRAADDPGAAPVAYLGPEYGRACLRRYAGLMRQDLYRTLAGFPAFYRACLRAGVLEALPVNGESYPPRPPDPGWMPGWGRAALGALNRHAVWLFALGALASLLAGREPLRAGSLLLFSVYHSAVLFAVLPEHKHAGPMVLPLNVFAGLGACALPRLAAPPAWKAGWPTLRARLPAAASAGLLLLGGWGLACGLARRESTRLRADCLADVLDRAARGAPAPEALRGPSLFSVRVSADPDAPPVGYLLRIRAGTSPGRLTCRHLRPPHPRVEARVLTTHHDLHPGREQYFFVTCFQGARHGDPRPLVCAALLEGDARFVDCLRLDLSGWKRGPMSTLFYPGQETPGSPRVRGASSTTHYSLPGPVRRDGLFPPECFTVASPPPAVHLPQAGSWGRVPLDLANWEACDPGVAVCRAGGALRVTTLSAPGSYALESPRFTAPRDGFYFFRAYYRAASGGVRLGVLAPGRHSWLALSPPRDESSGGHILTAAVVLRAGQEASLVLFNDHPLAGQRSCFELFGVAAYADDPAAWEPGGPAP